MTETSLGVKLSKRGAVHAVISLTMRINIYPYPVADPGFVGCEAYKSSGALFKKRIQI